MMVGHSISQIFLYIYISFTVDGIHGKCQMPLGMQTWHILDGQLSSSAWYSNSPPWRARLLQSQDLGNEKATWQASSLSGSWIQVDLILPHTISGIATHGYESSNSWVSSYSIDYSTDGISWTFYMDGVETILNGNHNATQITVNDLTPFQARFVRINPRSRVLFGGFNFELYGCVTDTPEIVVDHMILSPPAVECTCSSIANAGIICKDAPSIEIGLEYLYHIGELALLPNVPFYSFPVDVAIEMLNVDGVWIENAETEVNIISDTELSVNFGELSRTKGIRLTLSSTKLSWCSGVSIHGVKAQACPPGHVQYKRSCYRAPDLSTIGMMTEEERQVCERGTSWGKNGHLVIINDWEENSFVYSLHTVAKIYIGLFMSNLEKAPWVNESKPEHTWTWSDGSPSVWSAWASGYPLENIAHGNCTVIAASAYFTRWNDEDCQQSNRYICEVEAEEYGDNWAVRLSEKIGNTPVLTKLGTSSSECLRQCQDSSEIYCLSVWWVISTRVCYMYDYNWKNFTSSLMQSVINIVGSNVYQRLTTSEECDVPLLWGDGHLWRNLSASGYLDGYEEDNSEIEYSVPLSCSWRSSVLNIYQWFQVEFQEVIIFKKITTMGDCSSGHYIRQYHVFYSNKSQILNPVVAPNGNNWVFKGSETATRFQDNYFSPPFAASVLRIQPKTWTGSISMRIEIYGCLTGEMPTFTSPELIGFPLGMESWDIMDGQISAQVSLPEMAPWFARRNFINTLPGEQPFYRFSTTTSFWQVDLILLHILKAIIMEGSPTSATTLTRFKLEYSAATYEDWQWYEESPGVAKVIDGAEYMEGGMAALVPLHPEISVRYLRIYAVSAKSKYDFRCELFGELAFECPMLLEEAITSRNKSCSSCSESQLCLDVPETMEVDFYHMHLLSGVVINIQMNPSDELKVIISSESPDGKWRTNYDYRNKILYPDSGAAYPIKVFVNQDHVLYKFGRFQKAKAIRITTVEGHSNISSCGDLIFKACVPDACPPGHAYFNSKCYRHVPNSGEFSTDMSRNTKCSRDGGWGGPSHLATPTNHEDYSFIQSLVKREASTSFGMFANVSFPDPVFPEYSYTWRFVTDNTTSNSSFRLWKTGEPTEDESGCASFISYANGYWQSYPCTEMKTFTCQVDAVVHIKQSGTQVWSIRPLQTIGSNYHRRYLGYTISECLFICDHYTRIKCNSVQYWYSARYCDISEVTERGDPAITFTSSSVYDYYMRFENGIEYECDDRLIYTENGSLIPGVNLYLRDEKVGTSGEMAFLGNEDGYWASATLNSEQYFMVDFGKFVRVKRLTLQNRYQSTCRINGYYIMYSNNTFYWHLHTNGNGTVNHMHSTTKTSEIAHVLAFEPQIYARYIKINPRAYSQELCIRFQMYGCKLETADQIGCDIFAQAGAYNDVLGGVSIIRVNGVTKFYSGNNNLSAKGMNIIIVNVTEPVCKVIDLKHFDTSVDGNDIALVDFLNGSVPDGLWIVGVSHYDSPKLDNAVDFFSRQLNIKLGTINSLSHQKIIFMVQKGEPKFSMQKILTRYGGPLQMVRDIRGIYGSFENAPLGMLNNKIALTQIHASRRGLQLGVYGLILNCRLYASAFKTFSEDYYLILPNHWLQITLPTQHHINGIALSNSYYRSIRLYTFKMEYSNDYNETFTTHSDSMGNIKIYPASVNYGQWRLVVARDLYPPIAAKHVRIIAHSGVGSYHSIQVELLGHPHDEDQLELGRFVYEYDGISTPPVHSSVCATGSSCFSWCDMTTSTLVVHFRTNHQFSHIAFYSVDGNITQSLDVALDKKHNNTEWFPIQGAWIRNKNESNVQIYRFSPLLMAQSLRISPIRDTPGCYDVVLYGSRTAACPPGAILYRKTCIWTHYEGAFPNEIKILCNEIEWMGATGVAVRADNIQKALHLGNILYAYYGTSGGYALTGGTYDYATGNLYWDTDLYTKELGNSSTANWRGDQPGTTTSNTAVIIGHKGYLLTTSPTTTARYIMCEVPASVDEEECEFEWLYGRYDRGIDSAYIYQSFSQRAYYFSQCLDTCGHDCAGVNYQYNTGLCQFSQYNRSSVPIESLTSFLYGMFVDKYCSRCNSFLVDKYLGTAKLSVSASSELGVYTADQIRMHPLVTAAGGAWYPSTKVNEWLKLEFVDIMEFTAIAIRGNDAYGGSKYTMTFQIFYEHLLYSGLSGYQDVSGKFFTFDANRNANKLTTLPIHPSIIARVLHIAPKASYVLPAMKIELYGCEVDNNYNSDSSSSVYYALGLQNDAIGLGQISGSSYKTISGISYVPDYGRLNHLNKWCPNVATDTHPWIQTDLIAMHLVNAVRTQAEDVDLISLRYSASGLHWTTVTYSGGSKEFNVDSKFSAASILTTFEPDFTARYVRLFIETYVSAPCLRLELYGKALAMGTITNSSMTSNISIVASSEQAGSYSTGAFLVSEYTSPAPPPWCADSGDADPTLHVDLFYLYTITGFLFTNGTNFNTFRLNYSIDANDWKPYVNIISGYQDISIPGDGSTVLSGVFRLRHLQFYAMSSAVPCMQFHIQGKKMNDCPPGFVQYQTKCYMPTNFTEDFDQSMAQCSRVEWISRGRLASPVSNDEIHFQVMITSSAMEYWTGIHRIGETWMHADHSDITSGLPWKTGSPGNSNCSTLDVDTPRLISHDCSDMMSVMCETDALTIPQEPVPRWLWMSGYIQAVPVSDTIPSFDLLNCLSTCLLKGDVCTSVNFYTVTRTCELLNVSRSSPLSDLAPTASTIYLEKYDLYLDGQCPESGLINGPTPIPNGLIQGTAGSDGDHGLDKVRMYNMFPPDTGFWKSVTPAPPARITVELNDLMIARRFAVQGSNNEAFDLYITEYVVVYSEFSAGYWKIVDIPTIGALAFPGLTGRYEIHEYALDPPLKVKRFQVEILKTSPLNSQTSLHLEIYGCANFGFNPKCSVKLGLEDGSILSSQLTSSSAAMIYGKLHSATASRLGFSAYGSMGGHWSPDPTDSDSWLQVDLEITHYVTGILIKGDQLDTEFVTTFTLKHSFNALDWITVEEGGATKVFIGSSEPITAYFSPVKPEIMTRFLRLYPASFYGGISMQWEVIGCPANVSPLAVNTAVALTITPEDEGGCAPADLFDTLDDNGACFFWCISGDTVLFEYKFDHYVYISGIRITTSRNSTSIQDIFLLISHDGFNKTEYGFYNFSHVDSEKNEETLVVEATLGRKALAKSVNASIVTSVSEDVCVNIQLMGAPTTGCPAGYARQGNNCFYVSNERVPRFTAEDTCQLHAWRNSLSLAKPKNLLIANFISGLVYKDDLSLKYWTDAYRDTTFGIYWKSNMEVLNWHRFYSASTLSTWCFSMDAKGGFLHFMTCGSVVTGYTCQTRPLDVEDTTLQWHYRCGSWPANTTNAIIFGNVPAASCLKECESMGRKCNLVAYNSLSPSCYLLNGDVYEGGLELRDATTDECVWEKIIMEKCEFAVMADNLYGMEITESTGNAQTSLQFSYHWYTWQPSVDDTSQWVMVMFDAGLIFYRIGLTGSYYDPLTVEYVNTFYLKFTRSGEVWLPITNSNGTELFLGPNDAISMAIVSFLPTYSLGLRFEPLDYTGSINLQMEAFACLFQGVIDCFSHVSPTVDIAPLGSVNLHCIDKSTVIMMATTSGSNFNYNMSQYRTGFGSPSSNYFIGNMLLSHITTKGAYGIRIDMWDVTGGYDFAEYHSFSVDTENRGDILTIDEFFDGSNGDGDLHIYDGQGFYSPDQDNSLGCAAQSLSGWWYIDTAECVHSRIFPKGLQNGSIEEGSILWTADPDDSTSVTKSLSKIKLRITPMLNKTKPNIALNKRTFQATTEGEYVSNAAIDQNGDGILSTGTCSQTAAGGDQWWAIDLEHTYVIGKVTIVNRADCCGNELGNLEIKVGHALSISGSAIDTSGYLLCNTFAGPSTNGAQEDILCQDTIKGSKVAIVKTVATYQLTLCEIKIYPSPDHKLLDEPCFWTDECIIEYSWCTIAADGIQDTNLTCQCRTNYRAIEGRCLAVADLEVYIDEMVDVEIVREQLTVVDVTTIFAHNFGIEFDPVDGTDANLNFTLFTSPRACLAEEQNCGNDIIIPTVPLEDLQVGARLAQIQNITLSTSLLIPAQTCNETRFICVRLERGLNSTYVDADDSNNLYCRNIEDIIICEPPIDMAVTSTASSPTLEITRNYLVEFFINVTVTHPGTEHSVVARMGNFSNFMAMYSPSGASQIHVYDFFNLPLLVSDIELGETQKGVGIAASEHIDIPIKLNLTKSECDDFETVCLFVTSDYTATFTEANTTDNIACHRLTAEKNCDPDLEVDARDLTIPLDTALVRGYNISVNFNITLHNTNDTVDITQLIGEEMNFNITLFLASGDLEANAMVALTMHVVTETNIADSQLQQAIMPLHDGFVVGQSDILIPRSTCPDITHLCAEVLPGYNASYSLAAGFSHVNCLELSPYKNCLGLEVEDPMIIPQPWIVSEMDIVTFTVNWTRGTDIVYTVDPGDGTSPIYQWIWSEEGHVSSFDSHETQITHNYTAIGNYTTTLVIGNDVADHTLETDIVVEPVLGDYIECVVLSHPHAAPVTVTFSIQPLETGVYPMQVWCDVDYADGNISSFYAVVDDAGHQFQHLYATDVPDVTATVDCFNHVSEVSLKVLVILQEAVVGLEAILTEVAFPTGSPALFNISMTNGSHVNITGDFGDGDSGVFPHPLRLSFTKNHQISHVYSTPGNYTVIITGSNTHFNDTTTVESVIIQNAVHPLVVTGPAVVKVPPGTSSFTISPVDNTNPQPSNVFCTWGLSPANIITEYSSEVMSNLPVSKDHTYTRADVSRSPMVNVTCFNLASSYTANVTCAVQEEISTILVESVPPAVIPGEPANITIYLFNGSNVTFDTNFGDGNSDNSDHPELFANTSAMIVQHGFTVIGNYSLDVTASNLVSSVDSIGEASVIVQHAIESLNLGTPDFVLWPSGLVIFNITAGQNQQLLENVHCNFDLDSGLFDYLYIPSLGAGEMHSHSYIFPQSSIGNVSISVSCGNMLSSIVMSATVEIIFDEVLLASLQTNGSVLWNHTSELILDIARFGSKSCFLFDMGDGVKRVIYGLPECATNATTLSIEFIEIPFGQMKIIHNYVYGPLCETNGQCLFTASVYAFNHVSNHTLYVEAVVLDWPCLTPNITLPSNMIDPSSPYEHMKSKKLAISPNVSINCMKTDVFSTQWTIQKSGQSEIIDTQFSEDFLFTVRMLPYGDYDITVTVAMEDGFFDVTAQRRVSHVYLRIIKTPLVVSIAGNSSIFLKYNRTLILDALNVTHDPDEEPEVQRDGLAFTWFCRRQDEPWPMEGGAISRTSRVMSQHHSFYQHGGCFGFGNAVLESIDGVFSNTTLDMFPYTDYVFRLEVSKDDRVGSAEVNLTVGPVDPPVVTIVCRSNCDSNRKRFSGNIMFRMSCLAFCSTKFGGLSILWKIHAFNSTVGDYEEVLDFEDKTLTGTRKESLTIKAKLLEGGVRHRLELFASTPGSPNFTNIEYFLVNKPPYGGECDVSPTKGTATETLFLINCFDWKEWNSTLGDRALKYEYRIRQAGFKRSLLFYYGKSARSSPVKFPVGNFDLGFLNEVVLFIVDSLGDSYEHIVNVTVTPPAKPREDVIAEIMKGAGPGGSFGQMIKSGDVQGALSAIYSATSIINVPANWVHPSVADKANQTDMAKLMKDRIAARADMIYLIAQATVDSPDALEQQNEVFRTLLLREREVPLDAQIVAKDKAIYMKEKYLGMKSNLTFEKKASMAEDVVSSTLRLIIAADYVHSEHEASIAANPPNDTDTTTTNPVVTETPVNDTGLDETTGKVGSVMQGTVGIVHDISDSILDDTEDGDPSTDIEFPEMTLMLGKQDDSELDNATFQAQQGKIKLPNMKKLFNKTDNELLDEFGRPRKSCRSRKMLFSKINPYMWDKSADEVNSPVAEFALERCDKVRLGRRKRSVGEGETLGAEIEVELGISAKPPVYINASQPDSFGLIYHEINITLEPKPVQISVYPLGNWSLEVLVNLNGNPTPGINTWNMTVPRNLTEAKSSETEHTMYISADELSNGTLIVGVREAECLSGKECEEREEKEFPPFEYNLTLIDIGCQLWDTNTESWSQANCKVEDGTPEKVVFKSNLFGSFGAGLFTPPNTINFGEIFDNLGQRLLDNLPVVLTIVIIALLFIPLAILCRRFDKRDKFKWAILPLVDNFQQDKNRYEMHVYTGFKNKGCTKSNVKFVLFGTDGDTGIRELKDGQRQNFNKGEVDRFMMLTQHKIGDPVAMQIWHDNSGEGKSAGWFLAKIVVIDIEQNKWYLFLCDNWLSVDEDDGRVERILKASSSDDDADPNAMLSNNINRKLFEDHIWLSVGYRKNLSSFTRVQRLACCFAILFLAMVVNAMWYGTETSENSQVAFQLGPISFTVHELYTSFMSSIIIFPPSIFIITFFAKSAEKPPRDKQGRLPPHYKRPKGKLPYWCSYIAWVVTAICIVVCVFFAIMYSLQFDKGKSDAWLVAFIFSFFLSALLMQPIKVILIAVILTFLFKQDSDVSEYKTVLGKPSKTDKEVTDLPEQSPMTQDELEEARKRIETDCKMRGMLREIVYFLFFFIFLVYVSNGNQDSNVYLQNYNLNNLFTSAANLISRPSHIYAWMRAEVIPNLFYTDNYNGKPASTYDNRFIANTYAIRLGPARLRQLRIINESCSERLGFEALTSLRCSHWYSGGKEDRAEYDGRWNNTLNTTGLDMDQLHNFDKAYIYRTENDLKGEPFWAFIDTLSGGGYVANLGNSEDEAYELVQNLQDSGWLDERTRAVFLEFNVWNANTNLFNLFIFSMEFPSSGGMFSWKNIDSVQLYRYGGAGGVFALLAEIACIIFVFVSAILEIRKILKLKKKYFTEFWSIFLLIGIALFFVSFGFYVNRSLWTMTLVEEVMNNRDKTVNFQPLAFNNNMFKLFLALTIFIVQLKMLHLLRYNKTISILAETLAQSVNDLFNFTLCAMIIFMAFACCATMLYWQLESYMTLKQTMSSLCAAFLGKFDFHSLVMTFGLAAGLFLLVYLITMMLLVVNFFIVILDEFMHAVKESGKLPEDHVVLDHFFGMVKSLVVKDNKRKDERDEKAENEDNAAEADSELPDTEDVLSRLDLFNNMLEVYMSSSGNDTRLSSVLHYMYINTEFFHDEELKDELRKLDEGILKI